MHWFFCIPTELRVKKAEDDILILSEECVGIGYSLRVSFTESASVRIKKSKTPHTQLNFYSSIFFPSNYLFWLFNIYCSQICGGKKKEKKNTTLALLFLIDQLLPSLPLSVAISPSWSYTALAWKNSSTTQSSFLVLKSGLSIYYLDSPQAMSKKGSR